MEIRAYSWRFVCIHGALLVFMAVCAHLALAVILLTCRLSTMPRATAHPHFRRLLLAERTLVPFSVGRLSPAPPLRRRCRLLGTVLSSSSCMTSLESVLRDACRFAAELMSAVVIEAPALHRSLQSSSPLSLLSWSVSSSFVSSSSSTLTACFADALPLADAFPFFEAFLAFFVAVTPVSQGPPPAVRFWTFFVTADAAQAEAWLVLARFAITGPLPRPSSFMKSSISFIRFRRSWAYSDSSSGVTVASLWFWGINSKPSHFCKMWFSAYVSRSLSCGCVVKSFVS
mgnify:CR=1 FL=1